MDAIVVGGGVSGLTAAVALKKRGAKVLLLEAQSRAGGVASSIRKDGFLCERGPNTLLVSKKETLKFFEENQLLDSALEPDPCARKRFIVQNGKVVSLPDSPGSFLTSPTLSWRAKLRLLREPWIGKGGDKDETIESLMRRRLGEEIVSEFVDPFISGIYAGDPRKLLAAHAAPLLVELEQKHGSLFRGFLKKRGQGDGVKRRMVSWPGGFSDFSTRMVEILGRDARFSMPVKAIQKKANDFSIFTAHEEFQAKRVIWATEANVAGDLLKPISPAAGVLGDIPYAPMCVLHLGFVRTAISHPLDGFGVLISRARKIRTLGALFSSTLFPNRAPKDRVLLTAFIGGAQDSGVLSLNDEAVFKIVLEDLRPLLGISGEPVFCNLIRWPRAIPQYEEGYGDILQACENIERNCPGLSLIGSYRGGVSLENCILNGVKVASL